MSDIRRFVQLDILTVKPFIFGKNLLLFIALAVVMGVFTQSALGVASMMLLMSFLYSSYPFIIGERSNMDAFYITLAASRRTVVVGRFVFVILLTLVTAAVGIVLAIPIIVWQGTGFTELLPPVAAVAAMISLVECVQLPIYFKFRYSKAKLATVPLMAAVIGGAVLIFGTLESTIVPTIAAVLAEPLTIIGIGVLILVICTTMSILLSLHFYQSREF